MNLLFNNKRFLTLFFTQLLGSFNDNFFKYYFIIIITIRSAKVFNIPFEQTIAISAILFTLPYFFFSTIAGQLADKYSNTRLISWIKFAEIIIMLVTSIGFMTDNLELLLIMIFFMGAQTTFFGPVRYGMIPKITTPEELTRANALIQTARFSSALFGILLGGYFASVYTHGGIVVSVLVVVISIFGYVINILQKHLPNEKSDLLISFNIIKSFLDAMKASREDNEAFKAIFNISWFWFVSVTILSVVPVYVKLHLHANQEVLTFFLVLFIVGVSIGSLLCDKLSKIVGEYYLLPIGLTGIGLMLLDIYIIGGDSFVQSKKLYSIVDFLNQKNSYRVVFDFSLICFFSGIYSLPQFAAVQKRSKREYLSRIIAANDLINAFFVVLSGGLIYVAFEIGINSIQILGLLAISCLLFSWVQRLDLIIPKRFGWNKVEAP